MGTRSVGAIRPPARGAAACRTSVAGGLLVCLLVVMPALPGAPQGPPRPDQPAPSSGTDDVEMVLVPIGQFQMGTAESEIDALIDSCKKSGTGAYECEDRYEAEAPRYPVTIGAFFLDRTEVTNAQFEAFIRATAHRTAAESQGRSDVLRHAGGTWAWTTQEGVTWRRPSGPGTTALPTHPVVHVSWFDAAAYCRWAGKRLPTEAEWEYAARGSGARRYPWGERWDSGHARHSENRGEGTTAPVGSYPSGASPFGVLDLAGNVWEWTGSLFRAYPYDPLDGREAAAAVGRRAVRGGGWNGYGVGLRAARRAGNDPSTRSNVIGFRCARTP